MYGERRGPGADRTPVYEWFHALGSEPKIITDGVTRVVDDLVVTSVPYPGSMEQKSVWLDRGDAGLMCSCRASFCGAPFPNHIVPDTE